MAILGRPARHVAAWTIAAILFCAPVRAGQVREHEVKAAFLYNFTRFIEWPDGTPQTSEPFRLCVVADGVTTSAVERVMAGESVNGRPAQTLIPRSPDEARRCQILFVGQTEIYRAAPLLRAVRGMPVLTVSDAARFVAHGGAIQFVLEDGRVRFDVNIEAAKRSGLAISSRLLQVARKIEGPS
jgi:hypothetical protein